MILQQHGRRLVLSVRNGIDVREVADSLMDGPCSVWSGYPSPLGASSNDGDEGDDIVLFWHALTGTASGNILSSVRHGVCAERKGDAVTISSGTMPDDAHFS